MKYVKLFLPILFLSGNCAYANTDAKDSFDKINNCVKNNDPNNCSQLVTADSSELLKRFFARPSACNHPVSFPVASGQFHGAYCPAKPQW